jgi:hypothetical protein
LSAQLHKLPASQPACAGDINLDRVVNFLDVPEWGSFEELSSGN